jgi:hypothetical protein
MQIAEFCHANKLQGTEFRPDWQSLACFGDADRIRRFLTHNPDGTARTFPLRRIVILEDFIGSGGMMLRPVRSGGIGASGSIDFAASIDSSLPVIVVPLLVCPEGSKRGFALEGRYPNVSFRPVMELPVSEFVTSASVHEAGSLDARIQTLLPAIAALVKGTGDRAPFYGIYGFQETGAKVVMYSNCPANSLPAIHYPSISWNPLFPRAARIL